MPLIFAGPGVPAGATCGRPAELLDLYPTLAELCGLPASDGLEGHSLVPQLKDADAPRRLAGDHHAQPGNHAVRTERWRYIRYADGCEELYDRAPTRTSGPTWPRTRSTPQAVPRAGVVAEGEREGVGQRAGYGNSGKGRCVGGEGRRTNRLHHLQQQEAVDRPPPSPPTPLPRFGGEGSKRPGV